MKDSGKDDQFLGQEQSVQEIVEKNSDARVQSSQQSEATHIREM